MKTKLLLLILSCVLVLPFPHRGTAQTADDFNEGLTATYLYAQDVLEVSWWGRACYFYEIQVTEDLDLMQWTPLPGLIPGADAPIHFGFAISGVGGNRMFFRLKGTPSLIACLFAEDSNMLIHDVRFIGNEQMRGVFSDGDAHFPVDPNKEFMDEGIVFSTGIAEDWNKNELLDTVLANVPGDEDLEDWMMMEGFGDLNTTDASGVEIEFEVDFDDPYTEAGIIKVPYIFASEEYYRPPVESQNDTMAIFLFELDEGGNEIPNTRTNIGLLPESETLTRTVSVFNAGEVIPDPGYMKHNFDQSGFTNNSLNSYDVGYSGFTKRFVAQGGMAGDLRISTVVQNSLSGTGRRGGAGVYFRGKYYHQILPFSSQTLFNTLSAYVVAFARDDDGTVKFVLYKLPLGGFPQSNHGTSWRIDLEELGEVTVLDSVIVANYDSNAWYHIEVLAEGDRIRAKYWEDGGAKSTWDIDFVDDNVQEHGEPLRSGTFGLIHTDIRSQNVAHWDKFNVILAEESSTNFGEHNTGPLVSYDWTRLGEVQEEWTIEADGNATGGRILRHHDNTSTVGIAMLRWNNDVGKLEQGKKYLMKIVVADIGDGRWDSAVFLEKNSIKVEPIDDE